MTHVCVSEGTSSNDLLNTPVSTIQIQVEEGKIENMSRFESLGAGLRTAVLMSRTTTTSDLRNKAGGYKNNQLIPPGKKHNSI